MYRNALRVLAGTAVLATFWSVLRLGGLTIFDWLASIAVLASLLYRPQQRKTVLSHFAVPVAGIYIFACAGALSMVHSTDVLENLKKVLELLADLSMMLAFVYVLASKKILTLTEVLSVLSVSGAVSSLVVILQGQFGLLTSLVPRTYGGLEEWSRLTGLAEHPIETGTTSALAVVIALGLATRSRRWVIYILPMILGVYSMQYSASLTANVALGVGLCALCVISRSYSFLIAWIVVGGIAVAAALSFGGGRTLLGTRLHALAHYQGDYQTLQSRETQWRDTSHLIDVNTVVTGNGYATVELPDHMDIHNSLLAALFHFGMLGLVSQCLFVWFFVARLKAPLVGGLKGTLVGCIIVFLAAYLTGPSFARRSLWIPMFMMGAYLPEFTERKGKYNITGSTRTSVPVAIAHGISGG